MHTETPLGLVMTASSMRLKESQGAATDTPKLKTVMPLVIGVITSSDSVRGH